MKILKKIKFYQLILSSSILVLSTSCDLEEEVFTEVQASEFGQTDEEVSALVGAAYSSYAQWIGGPWNTNIHASDLAITPQRGTDWAEGGEWARLHQHTSRPDDRFSRESWNALFTGINNVNRILFQLEEIGSESSLQTAKELRVLRAINYYLLMDMFGNVPLVISFDNAEEAPSNASRAEIYNFVISEVEAVINDLPTDIAGTYGKVNKMVANALLAKAYLNAEVYVGTPEWQKAIDNADAIIDSGAYSLATNFFDNFAANNQNSPENIFVFIYDEVFSPGMNVGIRSLHYQSQLSYDFKAQPWNGISSLEEFYNSFDDEDVRKNSFLEGPQFDTAGNQLMDEQAEPGDPDGAPLNFTPQMDAIDNALRQQGVRIGKFEYEIGADPGNINNDFPLFRYGDILLTKAEAELRLGNGPEALVLVNMLRSRAGVPEYPSITLDELLDERGRETAFEGYRRQDLIRFGTYNDSWQFHPVDPSTHVNIFPIPTEQLIANPNLEQNPGY